MTPTVSPVARPGLGQGRPAFLSVRHVVPLPVAPPPARGAQVEVRFRAVSDHRGGPGVTLATQTRVPRVGKDEPVIRPDPDRPHGSRVVRRTCDPGQTGDVPFHLRLDVNDCRLLRLFLGHPDRALLGLGDLFGFTHGTAGSGRGETENLRDLVLPLLGVCGVEKDPVSE